MTKKMFITMAAVLMSISTLFADNDLVINPSELPSKASEFISTYFADNEITFAKLDKDIFENRYEVRLSNGVELVFFKSGDWKEIDAEGATVTFEMPEELIPVQIRQYVETVYAGSKIKSIEKEGRFTDINLRNGLELRFDSSYKLVEIDD